MAIEFVWNEKEIEKFCITCLMKVADECMRVNAEAASNVGLEVTVTRRYTGKGLSGGRECQWCKDRECEEMPYREALELGAFQRHPGCCCELYYRTEKGLQRQKDWTHNVWEDIQDPKELERRKNYNLIKKPSKEVLEMRKTVGLILPDKETLEMRKRYNRG